MCIQPFQNLSAPLIDAAGTQQGSPTPLTQQSLQVPPAPALGEQGLLHAPLRLPSFPLPIDNRSDLDQSRSLSVNPQDLSHRHELCKKPPGAVGLLVPSKGQQRPSPLSLTIIQMVPQYFSIPQIFPSVVLKTS